MESKAEWITSSEAAALLGLSDSGLRKRIGRHGDDLVEGRDVMKVGNSDAGGHARWALHRSLVDRWLVDAGENAVGEAPPDDVLLAKRVDFLEATHNAYREEIADSRARATEAEMVLLRTLLDEAERARELAVSERDAAREELADLHDASARHLRRLG